MKIIKAKTAGFCFGVDRAVKLTYGLLEQGVRVATLGPLIHNPQCVADLAARGAVTVDTPEQVPDGYEAVCRLANGSAQERLSRNSYIMRLGPGALWCMTPPAPLWPRSTAWPAGRVRRAGPCWSQATKTIPRCRASWDTHGAVYLFLPIWRS